MRAHDDEGVALLRRQVRLDDHDGARGELDLATERLVAVGVDLDARRSGARREALLGVDDPLVLLADEETCRGSVRADHDGRDATAEVGDELLQPGDARPHRGRGVAVEDLELLERRRIIAERFEGSALVVEQRGVARELVGALVEDDGVGVAILIHEHVGGALQVGRFGLLRVGLRGVGPARIPATLRVRVSAARPGSEQQRNEDERRDEPRQGHMCFGRRGGSAVVAGGAGEGGVTGARGATVGRVRGGFALAAELEVEGAVLGSALTTLGLALGSGGIDSAASDVAAAAEPALVAMAAGLRQEQCRARPRGCRECPSLHPGASR